MSRMRRLISIALALVLLFSNGSIIALADIQEAQDVEQTIDAMTEEIQELEPIDDVVEEQSEPINAANASTASSKVLILPTSLKKIEQEAFYGDKSINKVVLGDKVERIEARAFANSGLSEIYCPSSIKTIDDSAFDGLTMLSVIGYDQLNDGSLEIYAYDVSKQVVTLPAKINNIPVSRVGIGGFRDCNKITTVTISNGIKEIRRTAFMGCSSLSTVTIPSSVTKIGDAAFRDCEKLTSITLSNGIVKIGARAFQGCKALTTITIPDSITSIADNAFLGCDNLKSIVANEGSYAYNWAVEHGYLELSETEITPASEFEFDNDTGTIMSYKGHRKAVNIPSKINKVKVRAIASNAFDGNKYIASVIIPNGVTSIGDYAFRNCNELQHVESPIAWSTADSIWPFDGCVLKEFIVTGSITEIPARIFERSEFQSLEKVTLPGTIRSIGDYAFEGCSKISSLTVGKDTGSLCFPDGLTTIGEGAFQNCKGLTTIEFPPTLVYINGLAFDGCTGLNCDLIIPTGVKSIGDYAFRGCVGLRHVESPIVWSTADSIWPFDGCYLEEFVVTGSIKEIPARIFERSEYQSLKKVNLPNTITSIGDYAFEGCSKITSLTVGKGKGSLRFPDGLTTIGEGAFQNCQGLEYIEFPNSLVTIGGLAFDGCIGLNCNLIIPDGIKSIGDYAFRGCVGLRHIESPIVWSTADSIWPFDGCYLEEFIITGNITEIPARIFERSEFQNLEKVTLPTTIISIGDYAFEGCSKITSLTVGKDDGSLRFPDGLTTIGEGAFQNCRGLTTIEFPSSLITVGGCAFDGCSGLDCDLIIPVGVRSIGDYAFRGCVGLRYVGSPIAWSTANSIWPFDGCSLEEFVITGDATEIPSYHFNRSEFESLKYVAFPNSITSIGDYSFAGCTALESLYIPRRINRIGENAFENCNKLTIYGESGSYAQTYANENGIKFSTGPIPEPAILSGQVLTPESEYGDEEPYGIEGVTVTLIPKDIDVSNNSRNKLLMASSKAGSTSFSVITDKYGKWVFDRAVSGVEYTIGYVKNHFDFAGNDSVILVGNHKTSAGYTTGTPTEDAVMPDPVVFNTYEDRATINLKKIPSDGLTLTWNKPSNAISYIYAVKLLNGAPSGGDDEPGISLSGTAQDRNVTTTSRKIVIDKSKLKAQKWLKVWVASVSNDGLRAQNVIYLYLSDGDAPGEVTFEGYSNNQTIYYDDIPSQGLSLKWIATANAVKYLVSAKILDGEPTDSSDDKAVAILYNRDELVDGDHFENYPIRTVPIAKNDLKIGKWLKVAVAAVNAEGVERWSVLNLFVTSSQSMSGSDEHMNWNYWFTFDKDNCAGNTVKAGGILCIKLKANNVRSFYVKLDNTEVEFSDNKFTNGVINRLVSICLRVPANASTGKHTVAVTCSNSFDRNDPNAINETRYREFTVEDNLELSLRWPLDQNYTINSHFGARKLSGKGSTDHMGVDFEVGIGKPIYAAADGTVEYAGRYGGYGNYVRISHAKGVKTFYGHMRDPSPWCNSQSKTIKKGDLVGYVGGTGLDKYGNFDQNAYAPHLHFGVIVNGINTDPLRGYLMPSSVTDVNFYSNYTE